MSKETIDSNETPDAVESFTARLVNFNNSALAREIRSFFREASGFVIKLGLMGGGIMLLVKQMSATSSPF